MDTHLIKPEVTHLPNRQVLHEWKCISAMVTLVGAGILAYIVIQEAKNGGTYDWEGTGIGWPMWLIPLGLGAVSCIISFSEYSHYYKYVAQGKVVSKKHFPTYYYGGDEHILYVQGYTRAGEIKTYGHDVNAYFWADRRIGDYVDFRKK